MAKPPFTHSLTPEQKAQQLKAREHSLGSADERQPAETNIAWEIQLKPQPMPEPETEPGSAPHAPADESIAPASRQEQAPTVPGSSARPAEQPLSPAGTSTSPLPAEGYIQAPDDPALAVPLVSSPPGPIARHSVRLDSSDQHPSAHATGGGAAGGKASAAASHADPAAVTATHGIDGGATASNASPVATPPGSTTTAGGATTPPATFQAQGSTSGQVKEDLQLHTQGALTISGQPSGPVQWDVASRQGLLGTLDIDQHGQWRYLLDNTNPRVQALGEGQQVTERFLVFATDASGTTRAVHVLVEVNGNNDRAVIAGATLGSITEDAQWHTGGKLSVTDADSGQAEFIPMSVAQGAHGTFTVAPDGTWTYTLDNAQPAVQALRDGDQLTDTIAVSSKDGTTQQITVTINGHDDQALIAGTAIGTVKADDQPRTGGKLTVTDPDAHQAEFVPMSAGQGAHGTFTLAPDGTWTYTLDNAQPAVQALRSGDQLTDTITVSSKDGTTQTLTVYVNGTNDAPSLRAISQHATEDGTAIHGQLSGSDADSGDILAYGCPQQTPGFTLNVDGSYSFDPSNAAYQHLAEGEQLVLQIPVTVTDQAGARATQTLQITVTGSNDQPVLALTPLSAHEGDVTLSGQLVAADIDAGDRQTFSSSTPVAGFMLNADGSYSFNPADPAYDHLKAGEQLTLDIPVTVTDSQGAQDTQHLLLTLTGTNDAPTLVVISVGTKEDAPVVRGQLTSIDADSGDILAYGCPQQTPGFALSVDGSYSFDPSNAAYQYLAEGEQLVLQIPVTVTDQAGARATQTLQITVTGTNDLPVMQMTPPMAGFEGSPAMHGHLLAIDMDVHDTLSYRAPAPVRGFALAADGSWTFDPADPAYNHLAFGQKQIVTLPVEVVDSAGGVVASQIQITVTGTNDAPTLAIQPARQVDEGAAAVHGQLTATDPDTGDALSYSVGQQIAGFTLNADGSYVFDPADPHYGYLPAGQKAIVTVPVFVTDAHGLSDTQQIQITVTGTNDVPIVGGIDHAMGAVAGSAGGKLYITGQLSVIDLDQGESHFQSQLLSGTYGVLEIKADGSWTYTANANNPALATLPADGHLPEHFTVRTADGTTHDIDLQIKGANAPAIFAGVSSGVVTEDQAGSISHHLTVTDPNAGESAFIAVDRDAHYGHFTLNAAGDWTYQLDNTNPAVQALVAGKTLTDSIMVGSVDGTPTIIAVTIMGANDGAVISGAHTGDVTEDNTGSGNTLTAGGQLSVTDPDAGQKHFIAMQNIAGDHGFGSFSIDAQGHWTYSADNTQAKVQALKDGETATDSISFMSADGTRQTVTVTLHGTQDRAVIAGAATGAVTEDQGVSAAGKLSTGGTLTVTDVDSGEAHFVAQTDVAGGN
ncbi:VCBS domain-containing protein, partial [Aeromonas veronii]|nr:VCBS domain-containing protein [Aeromonas veronii]